jgi:Inner membrane protein YgaP-like, transmembrane domain
MTQNVGTAERLIRILVGVAVLALTVVGPKTWWGLVGLVPLGTGLWGW